MRWGRRVIASALWWLGTLLIVAYIAYAARALYHARRLRAVAELDHEERLRNRRNGARLYVTRWNLDHATRNVRMATWLAALGVAALVGRIVGPPISIYFAVIVFGFGFAALVEFSNKLALDDGHYHKLVAMFTPAPGVPRRRQTFDE